MEKNHQFLSYRGQLKGLVSAGTNAAFITTHEENQATGLYRLDASGEKLAITGEALPCGATALVSDGKQLWLAGQNGTLYQSALANGKLKALAKLTFAGDEVLGLAWLSANRLAVLQPKQLSIIDYKQPRLLQQISYTEPASALGSSPDGDWLAVGNAKGSISVYQSSESADFVVSAAANVHKGRVSAICFEQNELRFYSAGTDKKLFNTPAQGKLEPLDKGRSSNHDKTINAILLGKERVFTAASDKTIKSWAYAGGQPVTFKECKAELTHLAPITYRDKPCLLAVGMDASIRLVGLSENEKFTELKWQLHDGYGLAHLYLARSHPTEREQGIKLLLAFDDRRALEAMESHFAHESDRTLREQGVSLLSEASHPYSNVLLENLLAYKKQPSVRKLAFEALCKRATAGDLKPYEKALANGFVDTAEQALESLAKRVKKEPRAIAPMVSALQHNQSRIRLFALSLLEKGYDKASPKASLQALQSGHADLQRAALIRLFQRKLLDDINVKRAILLAQDHKDAQLRHTAFLVSVLSQKALAQALKTREPSLARQLQELEDFELLIEHESSKDTPQDQAEPDTTAGQRVDTPQSVASKLTGKPAGHAPRPSSLAKLSHDDYTVLLQGMTNRHADICFMSAFSLSVLGDQRAFGLLLLLSQEKDAAIRVGVCRAFGWLKQPDGVQTLELMLNDAESGVRDAAFTALDSLQPKAALTAEKGLTSKHEDIHARALKVLLDVFSDKLSKAGKTEALALLTEALNDPFDAIRKETFKACLNRQLGGSDEATLRLLLNSRFENIHLEVLNELMTQSSNVAAKAWVEPLLFERFNDDFEAVREAAFDFAMVEKKRFDRQSVLAAAVDSRFLDTRHRALKHMQKRPTQAEQVHLQQLLEDKDTALRHLALSALVSSKNSTSLLHQALKSPYDDIQLNAARALAASGDAQAFGVLEALANREQPQKKAALKDWTTIVVQALGGLGRLGDPRGFPIAQRFIDHEDKALVEQAAYILPWVSDQSHVNKLKRQRADERPQVRVMAALALALLGEKSGHLVLAQEASSTVDLHLDRAVQLAAGLCQPPVTITTLQPYLTDERLRRSSLFVLAAYELLRHSDAPTLSTLALSIDEPAVQLFSADLMVRFSEPTACWQYLSDWLAKAHHKADDRWSIRTDTLQQMAAVLVHGEGQLKVKLLGVMDHLEQGSAKKTWDLHYQAFCERYTEQIAQAQAQVAEPTPVKPLQNEWNQRAFGAYLGLVRQQPPQAHAVNPYALQGLHSLAALTVRDASMRDSVNSCLLTLLNHQHVDIRQQAFKQLTTSGLDAGLLGHTAITSPQSDIAGQGLELLTTHYPVKQSRRLLEGLITSDNEILSHAAYRLYRDENGWVSAAEFALQSETLTLRGLCVGELNMHYEKDKKAQQCLLSAATNDHALTANRAGFFLAIHRHPQALAVLKQQLDQEVDASVQTSIISALCHLPDTEVAKSLLDYFLTNPLNRQTAEPIYRRIADYRYTGLFPKLLECLEKRPKESRFIMRTLLTVTGYDQHLVDFAKEQADQRWLDKQHPRHDDLLIQYFNTLIKWGHHTGAAALQAAMSWTKDPAADAALADAIPVIAEKNLSAIIEAIVYRVERHGGDIAGLLLVLSHKNSDIQFIAAEGLANNGHGQGFNVLFAAVDYQENYHYRQRAVLALGKLADERALDKLLKLTEAHEHALNEVAIEAVGHLRESAQAEKIFKRLKSSLEKADSYSDMNQHALNGLRWFGSLEAWQLIGQYAVSRERDWDIRRQACELLRHKDTDGNRALLLNVLRTDDDLDVVETAYASAQLLWHTGDEPCSAVDYALIQGHYPELDDKALERIVKHAPTADLLMLLGADYALDDEDERAERLRQLGDSLLKRDDYRTDELKTALQSENAAVVSIVARLLIRIKVLTKPVQQALQAATERFYQRWQAQWGHAKQGKDWSGGRGHESELAHCQEVLLQLLWSAVQQGVKSDVVTQLLSTENKQERVFQRHILNGLLARDDLYDTAMLTQLNALLQSPLRDVNQLAAQRLARDGDKASLSWKNFVSQPEQLPTGQFTGALQRAAAQRAHQAQALPILISQEDTTTLHTIATDAAQQESLRVGALEGLARILTDDAEQALRDIHKNSEDQDVAKAAYRALRRQQRAAERALRRQATQQSVVSASEGA